MLKISLRAARINAGYTQKEASAHLGISNKTLTNWEKGITFPPTNMILKICKLYKVAFDNLNFLPDDSL